MFYLGSTENPGRGVGKGSWERVCYPAGSHCGELGCKLWGNSELVESTHLSDPTQGARDPGPD